MFTSETYSKDVPGNDLQHIEKFNQICQLRLNQAEAEKIILDRKICQVQQKIISEFQQRLGNAVQPFIMKRYGKKFEYVMKNIPPEIRK